MSREMHSELFDDASTTLIEVRVLGETLREANHLIGENGWKVDEGLRIIFANGLYYLRGQKRIEGLDGYESGLAAEVERLSKELMDMQSMYAVMKFRAFSLEQAKQTLEFNVVGLEGENRWSGERMKKFREDEELIRAEVDRLRQENEQLRQRLSVLEGTAEPPPPETGLVRRLLRRVRG